MKLITISGLDGSGKSTQVEKLKKHLQSQGKKVLYFHAIEFSLAEKIKKIKDKYCIICKLRGKCASDSVEKSVIKANRLQIILRKMFLYIDVLRFKRIYVRKYARTHDYILSDRYFYDTIINIKYLSQKDEKILAEKIIPAPDKAFYLKTDPTLIMQRERVPDQGIEYLKKKSDLFEENYQKWKMESVDGNNSEENVFNNIKSSLN